MPETTVSEKAFQRTLLRSVAMPVIVMTLLAILLILQVRHFMSAEALVEHTDDVLARISKVQTSLYAAQASVRGFLISGDEAYLQPMIAADRNVPVQLAELRALTSDRAAAGVLEDEILAKRAQWRDYAMGRVDTRRKTGTVPTNNLGQGKLLMEEISALCQTWINQEQNLRDERNAETQRRGWWTIAAAGGVTILVGVFLSFLSRGQLRWLSLTYEGALGRARDLSDQLERRVQERTLELKDSNAQLAEANKELEAFAYSVSHDLRAPMRHISGFANLLQQSTEAKLGSADRENLETIFRTAVFAGRMVDDLLAFSRIGRTQLRCDVVNMDAVVTACVRELGPELAAREIEWKINPLPPTQGDSSLLKLVMQNLLGNAVKYTGKRAVAHIEIGASREAGGTTYFVRDNGVGFDMAYSHKLFGVFQRLHRAEDFEGTGIGLANVRRIVMRHGGRAWAEGTPDGGATFSFHLPSTC